MTTGRTTRLSGGCPRSRTVVNPTPRGGSAPHNDRMAAPITRFPALLSLAALGGTAAGALVAAVLVSGDPGPLVPSLLPALFLVAGALGGRARPDHRGLQALTAVGALHLASFAVTVWLGLSGRLHGWGAWSLAALADGFFLAGFAALALVIGCYPDGRVRTTLQCALVVLAGVTVILGMAVDALLHPRLELVLSSPARAVEAPGGLPLASVGFEGVLLALGCVLLSVPVLVLSARSLPGEERRALGWARLGGSAIALMLVATPLGSAVLPGHLWDAVFITTVGSVPFLLLAGLVRYRLLEVDLYVARTVARGVVLVLVLAVYAALAAWSERSGATVTAAAVVVTVLAAATGQTLLRRLEALADRWFGGGRVGQRVMLGDLGDSVATTASDALPERLRNAIEQGLDVSWVRLASGGRVLAGPTDAGAPAALADLVVAGDPVGTVECGPRRGGWGPAEVALLRRAASTVAPALRQAELARELAARVDELAASRGRLVQAEETARRRIERDLHDGVQQLLVALLARLSVARARLLPGTPAEESVVDAHDLAQRALQDLRALVSGIHPPLLGDRGLVAAVEARVAPLPIEVEVDVDPRIVGQRFEPEVEGAAYFVVSEALTNVMKHSGAGRARVVIAPHGDDGLRVAVTDAGRGTASYDGSGLSGLRDRVEALGGRFVLQATDGVGTTVVGEFVGGAVAARV